MVKKHFSISLLFIALAILLLHNVIPHHHHHHGNFDGLETAHHHSIYYNHVDDHNVNDHGKDDNNRDDKSENESSKFWHLFSHYEHCDTEIFLLTCLQKDDSSLHQSLKFFAIQSNRR